MSASLERLCGLEEEQERRVRASKEDPAHERAVAEDHAATLELRGEDESTRQAVEVRACVSSCGNEGALKTVEGWVVRSLHGAVLNFSCLQLILLGWLAGRAEGRKEIRSNKLLIVSFVSACEGIDQSIE